jgi:2'-5' RNA ligase
MLEGLDIFDHTGVLFAGVKVSQELFLLQERVTKVTALCGFSAEARPFRPHLTLARSKGGGQRQSLRELRNKIGCQREFTRFVAEEFLLHKSFLGPGGSRYEVRERFPLDGR